MDRVQKDSFLDDLIYVHNLFSTTQTIFVQTRCILLFLYMNIKYYSKIVLIKSMLINKKYL